MTWTMRGTHAALLAATLAGTLLNPTRIFPAVAQVSNAASSAQTNTPPASDAAVRQKLNKKQFLNVKVSVDRSIATLSGTVDIYAFKADAAKRVSMVKGITAVQNRIEVAGPSIPDDQLRAQILEKLSADRPGYTSTSKSIGVSVKNGLVVLAGHVGAEVDKDLALDLVSNCPGVKNLVSMIEVDSPGDIHNRTISGPVTTRNQ
ncbi:MAG: BON domain-containing protein [Terracidiphilus sp.]|jgi:osmotically-inducible protein OsmY